MIRQPSCHAAERPRVTEMIACQPSLAMSSMPMFGVEVSPTARNGRVNEKRGTSTRVDWRGNERMSHSTMLDPSTALTSCHELRSFGLRNRIEMYLKAVEKANLVFVTANYRKDHLLRMCCVAECVPTLMTSGNVVTVVQKVGPTLKLDRRCVSDQDFPDATPQWCCICRKVCQWFQPLYAPQPHPQNQSHCKVTPSLMAERTRSGCRRIIGANSQNDSEESMTLEFDSVDQCLLRELPTAEMNAKGVFAAGTRSVHGNPGLCEANEAVAFAVRVLVRVWLVLSSVYTALRYSVHREEFWTDFWNYLLGQGSGIRGVAYMRPSCTCPAQVEMLSGLADST